MRIKLIGPLYSYRCCFFPGFPAIARVSEVAAVLPAVKFSHSAHTEYELRAKRNKLKLILLILSISYLIPLILSISETSFRIYSV